VIQLGPDPLYARVPVRNFPRSCAARRDCSTLASLAEAMRSLLPQNLETRDLRRARVSTASHNLRKTIRSKARSRQDRDHEQGMGQRLPLGCHRGTQGHGAVGARLPLDPWCCVNTAPGFRNRTPAALAGLFLQVLASTRGGRRLVIATMGDVPTCCQSLACHQIAESLQLPLLVLILNIPNGRGAAIRARGLSAGMPRASNVMPC